MSTGLVILHILLAGVALLIMMNGYARGAWKDQIDAVLSVLWILLLVLAFWLFGWRAGLAAFGLSFVYAWFPKFVARAVVSWVLHHPPR